MIQDRLRKKEEDKKRYEAEREERKKKAEAAQKIREKKRKEYEER
jgi:hypothetical protein